MRTSGPSEARALRTGQQRTGGEGPRRRGSYRRAHNRRSSNRFFLGRLVLIAGATVAALLLPADAARAQIDPHLRAEALGYADAPDRLELSLRPLDAEAWLQQEASTDVTAGDFDIDARELPAPRLVVDAGEYPWSAIGRLNFAGRGFCTAFLIGSDLAFTAAHCLYDPATGEQRALSGLHMVAGYQRDDYLAHARVAAVEVREAAPRRGEPTDSGMEADLAILQLEKPIGIDTGWLPLRMLQSEDVDALMEGRARLLLAGYSRRRPHAMELHAPCLAVGTARAGRLLVHDCVMEEGASGAPLLLADDRGVAVVGLGSALATLGGGALRTVSVTTRSLLDSRQEPIEGRLSRYLSWPQPGAAPGVGGLARARPDDTVQRLAYRADQRTADGCPLSSRANAGDQPAFADPATDALLCLSEAVLALP